jgi:hypothetical protein
MIKDWSCLLIGWSHFKMCLCQHSTLHTAQWCPRKRIQFGQLHYDKRLVLSITGAAVAQARFKLFSYTWWSRLHGFKLRTAVHASHAVRWSCSAFPNPKTTYLLHLNVKTAALLDMEYNYVREGEITNILQPLNSQILLCLSSVTNPRNESSQKDWEYIFLKVLNFHIRP